MIVCEVESNPGKAFLFFGHAHARPHLVFGKWEACMSGEGKGAGS